MQVEIGHKIKEVFENRDIKLTDFADELGTVRQNVYRIFKKRHLDTGLLLKVSQVLDHNFFQYYVTDEELNNNIETEKYKKANAEMEHQLELAKKEINYLRKIIRLMEEKAELAQQVSKEEFVMEQ